MLLRLGSAAALLVTLLVGCTGGDDGDRARARTHAMPASPSERRQREALGLPERVPLAGSGAADPAQAKVIRAWAGALRGGDVAGASALWALPSTAQNATAPLRLRSRADVRAFNASLPCGAVVTQSRAGAHGFTIVTVRLTHRRGADCGPGVGGVARTAIRVHDGRIAEWYRLPDDPRAPVPDTDGGPTVQS
jgi:hypothetical protein